MKLILTLVVGLALAGGLHAQSEPEWIWGSAEPGEGEEIWFVHAFELDEPARAGQLAVTCDNEFSLWLNGNATARGKNWSKPQWRDLAGRVNVGWNVIAVVGKNTGGPAGLALEIELELESGQVSRVVSDGAWQARATEPPQGWRESHEPGAGWSSAVSFGSVKKPAGPWPNPFAPRVSTPAEAIEVPPGFTVELLRSAQPWEGSWVAMTFDPQGRLIVSPQQGRVMRSVQPLFGTDALATGQELTLEPIAIDLGGAQGLLCAHDSLYVNVVAKEEGGGGLHRLSDTDGDGRYDEDRVLRAHGHPSEHGTHAVVLGPDDLLYVIVGNHVPVPAELAATSPHRGWAEDLLLPRLWDPRGHAVGIKSPGAHVLRTDSEGSRWELIAAGMRNAYDLAFDAEGELFTYDSDMEWDIGTPWYRAPRVLHITSAAEFGWRSGTGKWAASSPDSLPEVVDTDLASPTGVCFAGESAFPRKWRDSFLACDWAYGRILAVHREAAGASYTGSYDVFVSGKPLPVADLAIGGDGACYFVTGGRGTQSGLYRVSYTGDEPLAEAPEVDREALGLRQLRRSLESLHGQPPTEGALGAAWPHLDHDDRWIRYAARTAVEHQPVESWSERALAETRPRARLEALLALARAGDPSVRQVAVESLLTKTWGTLQPAAQLVTLRVASVCLARGVADAGALREPMLAWLTGAYPATDPEVDPRLFELLVHLQAPDLVETALTRLEAAASQEEALAIALPLRLLDKGWSDDSRSRFMAWLRNARSLEGGLSLPGFVAAIEKEWLGRMDETARQALVTPATDEPEEVAAPAVRPFVKAWATADLEPHLDAVASGRDFDRGREAFTAALCIQCHRLAGKGGSAAPDLTGAGSRFSRRDLLEAILEPSKVISDQYQQVLVTRKDGTSIAGRQTSTTPESITLDVNPFGGSPVEIPRAEIQEVSPSPVSLMPPGLVTTLTRDEILDLLAYLESGGDPKAKNFE